MTRYIAIITVILFPLWASAGILHDEWNNPDNVHKITLFQYLAQRPAEINSSGPVTIYARNLVNLGYAAYAQTISEIVRHHFPEQNIRVIIPSDLGDIENISRSISFDPSTEALFVPTQGPSGAAQINAWLDEASIIFVIDGDLTNHFSIQIEQLSTSREEEENEVENLARTIAEYREYSELEPREQIATFRSEFMRGRVDTDVLLLEQADHITDQTIPAIDSAKDIINKSKQTESTTENLSEDIFLPQMKLVFIQMGFTPFSAGMLARPLIAKLLPLAQKSANFDLPEELRQNVPEVAQLLNREAYSHSAGYHFYTAYMHNHFNIISYISTVSYLEPNNEPVILSNFPSFLFQFKFFEKFMTRFGIGRIRHTNLETQEETFFDYNLPEGRAVHVVYLPRIKDNTSYYSLFAMSANPVGVTGNQSLFSAITLRKIPFYESHNSYQRGIAPSLNSFDDSGLLAPVFLNSSFPQEVAQATSKYSHLGQKWADNILAKKNANGLINTYVRLSTQPDAEIEALISKINALSAAGVEESDDPIINDVLLFKRLIDSYNSTLGNRQSPDFYTLVEKTLHILQKLKDPDIRLWLTRILM